MALIVFELGTDRFAVLASAVVEIVRAVTIAALPKGPPIVEGVINYRGAVVPVLDIRQRFSRPPTPLHPGQHFVIARAADRIVALRVDRVTELISVAPELVDRTPPAHGVEYIAGVARLPDGVLVIHDLERFLAHDEVGSIDRALAESVVHPDVDREGA